MRIVIQNGRDVDASVAAYKKVPKYLWARRYWGGVPLRFRPPRPVAWWAFAGMTVEELGEDSPYWAKA